MLQILAVVALLATVVVLPVLAVRGLVQMYRDKARRGTISGSIAGALMEIDRAARPSVQYIVEVQETANSHEDSVGGT